MLGAKHKTASHSARVCNASCIKPSSQVCLPCRGTCSAITTPQQPERCHAATCSPKATSQSLSIASQSPYKRCPRVASVSAGGTRPETPNSAGTLALGTQRAGPRGQPAMALGYAILGYCERGTSWWCACRWYGPLTGVPPVAGPP